MLLDPQGLVADGPDPGAALALPVKDLSAIERLIEVEIPGDDAGRGHWMK